MKILAFVVLITASAFAQDPVKVTPGTPAVRGPAEVQQVAPATPPPPVAPDTVVVEVDGKKITAAEVDKIIDSFPPANQPVLRSRPQLLSQVFLMQRLAADAEKAGIDKQSPYKQQLEFTRLQLLSTAEMNLVNNSMQVSEEEEKKYYQENLDKFKEVKIRAILVAFSSAPGGATANGKKLPTEAEAKSQIEDVVKKIQGGADFGKLAREISDDPGSASKDGDFGFIKTDSAYPEAIKAVVFALKQGEMSAPIKQPNGFYLLRAEEIGQQPLNDVFGQIAQTLRQVKFKAWLAAIQAQYNVKVDDPAYFAPRAPAQLQQVH